MIHFLRDKQNNTIIEISAYEDVRASVDLEAFSERLLAITTEDPAEFVADMEFLNNIRAFWFEVNYYEKRFKTTNEMAKHFCKEAARKWNLYYVTD